MSDFQKKYLGSIHNVKKKKKKKKGINTVSKEKENRTRLRYETCGDDQKILNRI